MSTPLGPEPTHLAPAPPGGPDNRIVSYRSELERKIFRQPRPMETLELHSTWFLPREHLVLRSYFRVVLLPVPVLELGADGAGPIGTQRSSVSNIRSSRRKSKGVSLHGGGMMVSIIELMHQILQEPAPHLFQSRTREGVARKVDDETREREKGFPDEAEEFMDACLEKDEPAFLSTSVETSITLRLFTVPSTITLPLSQAHHSLTLPPSSSIKLQTNTLMSLSSMSIVTFPSNLKGPSHQIPVSTRQSI
ncbi:hypothetical protein K435DRAFT_869978 [Dendrothele bispora CBS 962.96]|uniref:Uncharacterized protein n=1 Tax=Dendrothele bispora (strain CBS 962.96) TaxID=1314807 RepID=A0A4S8L7N9_DENBC|nr:hypothetical protein K435DRAFT_869978 [Dendrothele bispora CBS 962.96]